MTTAVSRRILLVAPLALTGAIAYLRGGQTPANQPAIANLDTRSLPALRDQFNHDVDRVRVILLLSPT